MTKEKLVEYIKKTKQAGYNNEQIKQALKNKGWNDSDITEAMFEVSKDFLTAPSVDEEPPSLYSSSSESSHTDSPSSSSDNSNSSNRKFNVMSIIAFALSFLVPLIGLVLAIIALSQIKKTGEKGKGFAIAAIVLNVLQLVFIVMTLVSIFAYFGMLNPSKLLPERCLGPTGLDCLDKVAITTSGLTVALRNTQPTPIIINNIQGVSCNGTKGGVAGASNPVSTSEVFVPFQVDINEIFKIQIDCDLNQGNEIDDEFSISWEQVETGLKFDKPLLIRGKVS